MSLPRMLAAPLLALTVPAIPAVSSNGPSSARAASGPTVTVTPSDGLDPAGQTVTIHGESFGGPVDGVYVRVCADTGATPGTPEGRPGADRCLGDPQHWVSNSPGATAPMSADGSFTVELQVLASFEGSEGESFDCTEVTCGIATRRDHVGGSSDYSLDTFTPLQFGAGPTSTTTPVPTTLLPSTTTTVPPTTAPTTTAPVSTTTAPATDADPAEGALDWGVKSSFRAYVEQGPAHGEVSTVSPAARNGDGTFRFAAAGGALDEGGRMFAPFVGGVRFTGHDGALDLTISDPRVRVDGDDGSLVVDARSTDLESGEPADFDDVVLATLDLSGATPRRDGARVGYDAVPAALTEAGAEVFSGFYQAGDALDPVTFTVGGPAPAAPVAAGSATTSTTATTPTAVVAPAALAATGAHTRALVAAGGLMLVGGVALVGSARRRHPQARQ